MTSNGQSITTWREAEHFAAAHMRSLGFADADVTPLGVDGGIDVLAGGAVAQVKHFSAGSIGAPIVQQLKGVAGADRGAVFYALSGYTAAALAFAESAGVALFRYQLDRRVEPISTHAARLSESGHQPARFGSSTAYRERMLAELAQYAQQTVDAAGEVGTAAVTYLEQMDFAAAGPAEAQIIDRLSSCGEEGGRLLHELALPMDVGAVFRKIAQLEAVGQEVATLVGTDYEELSRLAAAMRAKTRYVPRAIRV